MSKWAGLKSFISQTLLSEEGRCAICNEPGDVICPGCEKKYFPSDMGRCRACGKLIKIEEDFCEDCKEGRGPKEFERVCAWGYYAGDWRKFIWDIKYKSQPYRLEDIAQRFSYWAIEALPPPDGIIPVPLSQERLAQRGFNQAEVLADLLKWKLGIPVIKGLHRKLDTPSQASLNRQERLRNLERAFVWSGNKIGKRVWLVDDVITTGATLEGCARTLREAGAYQIYGLTLAAGMEKKLVTSEN